MLHALRLWAELPWVTAELADHLGLTGLAAELADPGPAEHLHGAGVGRARRGRRLAARRRFRPAPPPAVGRRSGPI